MVPDGKIPSIDIPTLDPGTLLGGAPSSSYLIGMN
jgi:hypothetical protein